MSTVELTRESDGPGLVAALAEQGLVAERASTTEHLAVQVEDCDEDAARRTRSRTGLAERGLPFVPLHDRRLHLRGRAACRLVVLD